MVMQTAYVWNADDRAAGWRLSNPRHGRILAQREVSAPVVVIVDVALQMTLQRALVQHDGMIKALAAKGADHALNVRIGVRCRLHRQRAVRHKPFASPIPSIRSVAGRFG